MASNSDQIGEMTMESALSLLQKEMGVHGTWSFELCKNQYVCPKFMAASPQFLGGWMHGYESE